MAQQKVSFITGANAKIKLDDKTFAYASDVSYAVSVDVIPIETIGRYEAVAHEPVNYSVAGELSVVRYTSIAKDNGMANTNAGGNGLGKFNQVGSSRNGSEHIDPATLLLSETWDLQVYQKQGAGADADSKEFIKISDCRFTRKSAALSKRGMLVDRLAFVGILASDDSFTAGRTGSTGDDLA